MSSQKLIKDLKELKNAIDNGDLDEITYEQSGDSWEFKIPGEGLYDGGVFKLKFDFTNYPTEAPSVNFITKIYSPQVSDDGSYCSKLLNPQNWNKFTTVMQIVEEVIELFNQTDFPNPRNAEVGAVFANNKAEYKKTVKDWVAKFAK